MKYTKYNYGIKISLNKKIQFTIIALIITTSTFAQIGIGTADPDASAALDITSTDKGLLPPRLTNAQRNSITPPIPAGLMVWCSDCGNDGELQVFNGSTWTNMIGNVASLVPFSNQQLGSNIDGATGDHFGLSISLSSDGTRMAIGVPLDDNNGINSGSVQIYDWNGSTWTKLGLGIIEGEAAYDLSGYSVALSGDGTRVAIGAPYNDDSGDNAGHVRLYDWNGLRWIQTGADINGEAAGDKSGHSVSLSADGTRIAIGSPYNEGNGRSAGHVRLYDWKDSSWSQVGTDIDGEAADDLSGYSVALSADNGTRVAIGSPYNDGNGGNAGHVRLYDWNGSSWMQTGLDIDGEAADDFSGSSVSISADGTRAAIGSNNNDGNGPDAGHVRLYDWNGSTWLQVGTDIDGEAANDFSGSSVSLSADGTRVAIGAPFNDGHSNNYGHVRLFDWNGLRWVQTGADIEGFHSYYITDLISTVVLSADGTRIAIPASSDKVRIFE